MRLSWLALLAASCTNADWDLASPGQDDMETGGDAGGDYLTATPIAVLSGRGEFDDAIGDGSDCYRIEIALPHSAVVSATITLDPANFDRGIYGMIYLDGSNGGGGGSFLSAGDDDLSRHYQQTVNSDSGAAGVDLCFENETTVAGVATPRWSGLHSLDIEIHYCEDNDPCTYDYVADGTCGHAPMNPVLCT